MAAIRLGIIGCGGMGHRHMYGLSELQSTGRRAFDLVGVYDPVVANAESLAEQAQDRLGRRPVVVSDLAELDRLGVEAVDITTVPRAHHTAAVEALDRGWHVIIEKPLGLTVRACNLIRRAAGASGRIVSVAENYRRDPINRLAKALLEAGAIGSPRFVIHQVAGGGDQMLISVWRHQKDQSGVLLDVGVHFTDMLEYLLGPIDTVYAQTRLHERIRKNPAALGEGPLTNPAGVYGRWQREMPSQFEATAEDAAYATITFSSGAVGQYLEDHAAHGAGLWARQIYGSSGSMALPNDRTGERIVVQIGAGKLNDTQLLDLVPDFRLDDVTAALFGGEQLAGYSFPFAETDRKLLAIEYAEFADAIAGDRRIEVDAEQGTRSVAASYAMLESGVASRPVSVAEVMNEAVEEYQRIINESLGI